MRVLMIGFTPPEEGGSERHIYELANRIKNVTVLTQKGSMCKNKIELFVIKKPIFLRNFSFFLLSFIYSLKLLSRKKYDIIHIHENLLYFFAPILKLRYKIIITIHGIKGFKFYDNKFLWHFFKIPLKFADKIITVSIEDKNRLNKEFNNVVYIPNGVDLSLYNKIKTRVKKKITFIGRIHEQKGLIYLLKAFEKIKDKFPDLKLEIIGKINEYAIQLQKKFPSKKIIWKGFISDREELVSALKSSYCIVLPSLWEGLPLTLFESLASGRPVLISSLPTIRTIIKDEAVFIKPKDSEDIARKIIWVLKNRNKAEVIGKKGKFLSKKFDWKKIAEKTNQIYEKT